MSVLKSKQTESNVEYVNHALELELNTLRICDRKQRKHATFLDEALKKPAIKIYTDVSMANDVYVDDINAYNDRRELLREAHGLLKSYSKQMDAFRELYRADGLRDNEYRTLTILASETRKMVQGVLNSDKARAKTRGIIK